MMKIYVSASFASSFVGSDKDVCQKLIFNEINVNDIKRRLSIIAWHGQDCWRVIDAFFYFFTYYCMTICTILPMKRNYNGIK